MAYESSMSISSSQKSRPAWPSTSCVIIPQADASSGQNQMNGMLRLALRFQDERHRALHQRVDGPIDRPPGKRDLVPAAQANLLQVLSHADAHERPKQIVETLGGRAGSGLLQQVVAILPISFLPQVRRDFREIEGKARPSFRHRHGVRDIRQGIGGIRRRLPASDAPERDRVSKLEITRLEERARAASRSTPDRLGQR